MDNSAAVGHFQGPLGGSIYSSVDKVSFKTGTGTPEKSHSIVFIFTHPWDMGDLRVGIGRQKGQRAGEWTRSI